MKIVIFDPGQTVIEDLEKAFKDLPRVEIVRVQTMLYLHPPSGLDALYLPLAAAERWGSRPIVHGAQILPTTEQDRHRGLPAFIVTGTCLSSGDERGPVPELNLLIRTIFEAISTADATTRNKIRVVGFWADTILRNVTAAKLREILENNVPEIRSSGGAPTTL